MLLDDSLEFEVIPRSNDAELIPMVKWRDIQLSDIWIPSKLLFNRQCLNRTTDVHKSVITHTLEKHHVLDYLSVYSENEVPKSSFSSSEKLLDSLEELPSKHPKTEENKPLQKVTVQERFQLLSNSQDIIENKEEGKKDTCLEEECDSSDNSIADYLEHLHISDDEVENLEDKLDEHELSTCAENYSKDTKLLEECKDKYPEELVCDISTKSDTFLSNKVKDTKLFEAYKDKYPGELVCDISAKSDTFFSNNEVTGESEVPDTKTFPNSDQMIDLVELSDQLWNDIKLNRENISTEKEKCDFLDETQDPGECINPERSLEHNQSSSTLNEIANCPEELVEVKLFPYLLQKSQDKTASTVSKNVKNSKKEKRVKKKAVKNIPLDNFFLTKEERPSSPQEYLDFYASLCQKHSYPDTPGTYRPSASSVFPTLTECNAVEEYKNLEIESSDNTMNLMLDSKSPFNCNENIPVIEDDDCLTKYVIENIPDFVDEEMLQNLILTYGDIKNLMMKSSEKKLKAVIIMMNVEDPNWLIECLNGTHPFGDLSNEGLKCYQIL